MIISTDSSNTLVANESSDIFIFVFGFEPTFCLKFIIHLMLQEFFVKSLKVKHIFSFFLKVEAISHNLSSERNDEYCKTIWHRVEGISLEK